MLRKTSNYYKLLGITYEILTQNRFPNSTKTDELENLEEEWNRLKNIYSASLKKNDSPPEYVKYLQDSLEAIIKNNTSTGSSLQLLSHDLLRFHKDLSYLASILKNSEFEKSSHAKIERLIQENAELIEKLTLKSVNPSNDSESSSRASTPLKSSSPSFGMWSNSNPVPASDLEISINKITINKSVGCITLKFVSSSELETFKTNFPAFEGADLGRIFEAYSIKNNLLDIYPIDDGDQEVFFEAMQSLIAANCIVKKVSFRKKP